MAARASSYGSVNLDVAEDVPMRVETPKGGLHRLVAAVMVGALCVASLVALARSNGLVSQRVSSVVDSNRDRLTLAPVPGVMDEAAKVANITAFGLRWAIFGFTKERNEIIPTMQGVFLKRPNPSKPSRSPCSWRGTEGRHGSGGGALGGCASVGFCGWSGGASRVW